MQSEKKTVRIGISTLANYISFTKCASAPHFRQLRGAKLNCSCSFTVILHR